MTKLPARILVVDDDTDILMTARVVLKQHFESVETERNPQQLNYLIQHNRYDVIVLDMNYAAGKTTGKEGLAWMKQILSIHPDQRIILITAYGDIALAVEAMKEGASDFVVKPWDNDKLVATVKAAFDYSRARKELDQLKDKQKHISKIIHAPDTELLGKSQAMQDVLTQAEKVAATDANVLILGENGTGKELLARLVHQKSMRSSQPFIKVDVGSIPANLFESELFGHKKGAFTDAREDRLGRMELANGGTLFLDEIGNVPLPLQSKLLSVLQNREVIPLGSNKAVQLDIRLICATNLNLAAAVQEGNFREDLLYRIRTVEITLPPLRARAEDIPLLATHFAKLYVNKYRKEQKQITDDGLRYLQKYSWPGNVRELQHAIERAVIMTDGPNLTKNDFALSSAKASKSEVEDYKLDEMERKAIIAAIERHRGNMSQVAKELGLGRTTLYRKMEKYGIDK
jgi:two-component system, NtrC family, response regulator HydG